MISKEFYKKIIKIIFNTIKSSLRLFILSIKYRKKIFLPPVNTKKVLIKNFKNETVLLYIRDKSFLINPSPQDFLKNFINFFDFDYLLISKKSISSEEIDFINFIKLKNRKIKLHCPLELSKFFEYYFPENEIYKYINKRKNILPIKYISITITFLEKNISENSNKNIWKLEINEEIIKV